MSLVRHVALLVSLCMAPASSWGAYTFLNVPDRSDYAFDANGILYISTSHGDINRFDARNGTSLTPFSVGGELRGMDLSPDGHSLAVADGNIYGGENRIHLVNTSSGSETSVNFTLGFSEGGTFSVAWGVDNQVLVTSSFNGSGWVPLRRYDPTTGVTSTIRSVRLNSMLTPSADRRSIALAEDDSSDGPFAVYDVPGHTFTADLKANRFLWTIAIDRNSQKLIVPSYFGASVYDSSSGTFQVQGVIGVYASHGPLDAVFSPVNDTFFTSEWSWSGSEHGVRVYDANTLKLKATIDPYQFEWGSFDLDTGRLKISPDGRFLAVSVDGGVRLYDVSAYVPEPVLAPLVLLSGLLLLRRARQSHKVGVAPQGLLQS